MALQGRGSAAQARARSRRRSRRRLARSRARGTRRPTGCPTGAEAPGARPRSCRSAAEERVEPLRRFFGAGRHGLRSPARSRRRPGLRRIRMIRRRRRRRRRRCRARPDVKRRLRRDDTRSERRSAPALPAITVPEVTVPAVNLPDVQLPEVKLPAVSSARDARPVPQTKSVLVSTSPKPFNPFGL